MIFNDRYIVITSNEIWGDVWYSKQHYAFELSQLGYRVIFINPPKPWSLKNLILWKSKCEKIEDNFWIVDIENTIPIRFFSRFTLRINDAINCLRLRLIIKNNKVLFWHFDPFRFIYLTGLNSKRIYHVVDPYTHLKTNQVLASKSDLIVLVDSYYQPFYPPDKCLIIPHGISHLETNIDPALLSEIKNNLDKDFLIVIGNFGTDIDYQLLIKISKSIDRKLILIGSKNKLNAVDQNLFNELIGQRNVQWLGKVHSSKLKYYISLSSIGIVPYKNKMSVNSFRTPLKSTHYLAQQKPVISSIRYDHFGLEDRWIFFSNSHDKFISIINSLLNNEQRLDFELLDDYLDRIRYPRLIEKILREL